MIKITKQVGHQGDTQWYSINSVPENAKLINKQFIAASEKSGNVHALTGEYEMYEVEDGFIIDAKGDCMLNHTMESALNEKTWNEPKELPVRDHRSSVIKKGLYFVGIQRKFNPLSKIMEKVRD
jgi:hypothetical protein